tara:strand:- start:2239 stop:2757 length:519 start_codon:yes stop_codon:yes gene_type:complete
LIIPGRNETARQIGVAPSTLRGWMDDPTFPDCSNGHPIEAINKWRLDRQSKNDHQTPKEGQQAAKIKLATAAQKLKREVIATKRESLDLEYKEGELYQRQSAELAFSTLLIELADWCDQTPDVIATTSKVPKKYQAGLRARLIDEFDQMRVRLRAGIDSTLRDLDSKRDENR